MSMASVAVLKAVAHLWGRTEHLHEDCVCGILSESVCRGRNWLHTKRTVMEYFPPFMDGHLGLFPAPQASETFAKEVTKTVSHYISGMYSSKALHQDVALSLSMLTRFLGAGSWSTELQQTNSSLCICSSSKSLCTVWHYQNTPMARRS